MWEYTNTDELYHYGVLGMKWRVHRAARNDIARAKLARKVSGNKEQYKLDVRKAKQKALDKVAKAGYDKDAINRIQNSSKAKQVAQTMLMTSYGALKYNQARAKGDGRAKAFVKGALHNNANLMTATIYSRVDRRLNKRKQNQ